MINLEHNNHKTISLLAKQACKVNSEIASVDLSHSLPAEPGLSVLLLLR